MVAVKILLIAVSGFMASIAVHEATDPLEPRLLAAAVTPLPGKRPAP